MAKAKDNTIINNVSRQNRKREPTGTKATATT